MESAKFYVLPLESRPLGLTCDEWTSRWWQWILSIPSQGNPLLDQNGRNAYTNQEYSEVFFLCQTYEQTSTIPTRSVRIKAGKLIIMPVINWLSTMGCDGANDEELLSVAKKRMDHVADLEAVIDGEKVNGLQGFRVLSPFFEFDLPKDNILGLPPGRKRGISDGYWIFVAIHGSEARLRSFGSCSSGATKIGVNYDISFI
jgi:hypothetical protein